MVVETSSGKGGSGGGKKMEVMVEGSGGKLGATPHQIRGAVRSTQVMS